MNYPIPAFSRRNLRAFIASLFSYLLLAGPVAPLAAASGGASPRHNPPASSAQMPTGDARQALPAPAPLVLVPNVTATKTDSFVDSDSDGKAEPGEVITYTVTITNNGTDATNVQFSDTVDINTTLVPGSITTQPVAVADAYNVIGNVSISPDSTQGLLVNDCDPSEDATPCTNAGLTVTAMAGDSSAPFSGTSTKGGQVTSSTTDGAFVYNPPPGFPNAGDNTDTFTYTVTDADGKTDTATVTLTVSTPIWFIDDNAAAGGDGRLTNPYNCYTGVSVPVVGPTCFSDSAADEAGDFIFLFDGNYTGGYTLLNNQTLIGQGASASLATITGVTVEPYTDPLPATGGNPDTVVITTTLPATNAVNLGVGNSNTLRGFNIGNTTGAKIASTASGFGTLTASEVRLSGNGQALNLDSGALAATFVSISSNTSSGQGISLDQVSGSLTSTGGTTITDPTTQCILVTGSTANVTFNNTSCTLATDGISLQNNSAGTRSFGTITVTGGTGIGFLHSNSGGAVSIGGATTITNPGGNGIDIQNTNVSISFQATSVDKGSTGGTGVNLLGISGFTITFSSLDINTNGGVGFNASGGLLNVTNAAGSEITTTGNAAMIISSATLGMNFTTVSSTNSTGKGMELNASSGGIAIGTTTITNSAGIGLHALGNPNGAAGTFSYGNANITQTGGTGVRFENNVKPMSFADLDINPDAGQRGFHSNNDSGTITITSGTITTTTGTAFEVAGASNGSRTALNMTLTQVNVSGAPSGIILTNTSANPGGFNLIGDNSNARNGSGGVMSNTTDDAIRLTNASNITLKSINLNSPGDTLQALIENNENTPGEHGIEAIGSNNIILSGILIDAPAGSGMIGLNVTGTNRLNNNSLVTNIDNPATHGLFLRNGSGFNMTLFEVNDTDFTNSSSGASTLNVKNDGTANMTVEVRNGCIFEALNSQAVTMDGGGSAGTTGTLTSLVTGNTFRNAVASEPSPGVFITSENNVAALVVNGATHNATISNNSFENVAEDGRVANTSVIRTQNSGGKLTAVVSNNTIQNINYQTGAGGRHVIGHVFEPVGYDAANFSNLRFENNTATNITFTATNREFIFIDYRDNASGGDIKILSNNWNMPTSAATSEAVDLNFTQDNASTVDLQVDNNGQGTGAISNTSTRFLRIDSEDAATVNATVTNNELTNTSGSPGLTIDFNTSDNAPGGATPTMCVNVSGNILTPNTIRLNEIAGTMNVTQASQAAVSAANGGATVTVGGSPAFGQPACALPSNAPVIFASANASPIKGRTAEESATPYYAPNVGGNATTYFANRPLGIMPRGLSKAAPAVAAPKAQAAAATGKAPKASGPTTPINRKGETRRLKPTISASGETVNVNIGTLRGGDSVEITFQVTVNDPYSGGPNVSNQGTVTFNETGSPVLTDDPATGGANEPTLTPIDSLKITAQDATVAEPTSGTTNLLFTVTLSAPANGPVSVDFTTVSGGSNPATVGSCPGADYVMTTGTLNYAAGQQVMTVAVPVCSDADNAETDETLLLRLTSATGGAIVRGQTGNEALGTITTANTPGAILISELRTSGPGGSADDFVEVYNNSGSPHTVDSADNTGYGVFKMGADGNATPVLVGFIPEGTVIPPRGHYLFVGTQYSLSLYPAGTATFADGDATLTSDIEDNRNVGIFKTADPAAISSILRLDAVGFGINVGGNADLLREGSNLPAVAGVAPFTTPATTTQYTFFRSMCSFVSGVGCTVTGTSKDTNDNSADFLFADVEGTDMTGAGAGRRLGAPGPEGFDSPARKDATLAVLPLDRSVATSSPPNRDRNFNPPDTSGTFGALIIRRRVENNTGAPVTRLRFRIVEITTFPPAPGNADLRALTSSGPVELVMNIGDAETCNDTSVPAATPNPCTVEVLGTTLEQPPNQPNGGGFNSSLSVTLGTPLAAGDSVNVQFRLGLEQTGLFRFLIIVEALP